MGCLLTCKSDWSNGRGPPLSNCIPSSKPFFYCPSTGLRPPSLCLPQKCTFEVFIIYQCICRVRNSNGVSMTSSSGYPYPAHGQPRLPSQPQPQTPSYQQQHQQQHHLQPIAVQQPRAGGGYVNSGFTPATLSVPTMPSHQQQQQQVTIAGQPVPMQPPSRPIQPVQVCQKRNMALILVSWTFPLQTGASFSETAH